MRKGKGLGMAESRWKKGEGRGENSVGKKTQLVYIIIHNYIQQHKFDQFWNFWWLLKTLPFADHGQVWHARVHTWSTVTCQISSVLVYYLEKLQILPHFQLQQSVVAPPSGAETSCVRVHNYRPFPIQWDQKWRQSVGPKPDSRPCQEGACYKFPTKLLMPTQPFLTHQSRIHSHTSLTKKLLPLLG